MAEVLGAAASAAQLVVYCSRVIEIIGKAKRGSENLRKYDQHLQEIRGLSDSIYRNPLLQVEGIGLISQSILKTVEKIDLKDWLNKSRLQQTLAALRYDRQLNDLFITLERQKTTLSLRIEEIQSRALHDIRVGVQAMSHNPQHSRTSPSDSAYGSDFSGMDDTEYQGQPTTVAGNGQGSANAGQGNAQAAMGQFPTRERLHQLFDVYDIAPKNVSLSYGNIAVDSNQYNDAYVTVDGDVADAEDIAAYLPAEYNTDDTGLSGVADVDILSTMYADNIQQGYGDQHNAPSVNASVSNVNLVSPVLKTHRSHHIGNRKLPPSDPGQRSNGTIYGTQYNGITVQLSSKGQAKKKTKSKEKEEK